MVLYVEEKEGTNIIEKCVTETTIHH